MHLPVKLIFSVNLEVSANVESIDFTEYMRHYFTIINIFNVC